VLEINQIHQGDSSVLLKQIEDGIIDLTVTSPPYDNLRDYNGYIFDFETIAKELYRITKEGGVVVWIVGDQTINGSETGTSFIQALFFMNVGFCLHDTMIYCKENYAILTHNRYEQQFEYMFIFSKGKIETTNLIKDKINKHFGKRTNVSKREKDGTTILKKDKIVKEFGLRPNVWFYKTRKNDINTKINHPAIFPEELAKDHILSWSNLRDIVLDPFVGSGTTCKMAKQNGRRFIGIDISKEYVDICNKRLKQKTMFEIAEKRDTLNSYMEVSADSSQS